MLQCDQIFAKIKGFNLASAYYTNCIYIVGQIKIQICNG